MCGIAGELRFDGDRVAASTLVRMSAAVAARGPDASGEYLQGEIGLAHRRLAIIDLSPASNQPMRDAALDLTLVFNGAIYNYRELRAELIRRGHGFSSQGDTEVILRAYAEWGQDCVERLHGMFAFALWDGRRGELFLARDRLGIKPLYYSRERGCLRFASNTQALLAAGGVNTALDPVAVHQLFSLHAVVPAPRTLLAGVRKLAPGHTLTLSRDGVARHRRYWSLAGLPIDYSLSERDWQARIHDELAAAVRTRLDVADVPVGVLLSGGLDSSLLVALLKEAGVERLHTFSVGFEDQPEEAGNEFEFSSAVARHHATEHRQFLVPNAGVLERLVEAVDHMAEPMFGQDAVAFYLLAQQVAREIKVVQSGQGADEVFGGYFWYPQIAAGEGRGAERLGRYYLDREHAEFAAMLEPGFAGHDYTRPWVQHHLDAQGEVPIIDQTLRLDATAFIVDDPVKRVDNMTMAWGLEARVPFLDHRLVETAARMPAELKLRGGGKDVLKRIARGLVPDAVIDRPKAYFPMPALKYVRGPFLELMRSVLDSAACRQRGLYRREYVDRLLAEPEAHHTRIQGSKLWHLTALELWLQRHVDGH